MRNIFYFFILAFSFNIFAQEPIYKHFGVDEGLPSSQIYDIYQTKDGYIWFATDKGLSRYNGYEFENFDINDGLPGNVVLRFYPQENGQIWAYALHKRALFYFNEEYKGFTPYKYNDKIFKEVKSSYTIKSLFIDDFKSMHFGGDGIQGLLTIKENGEINRKYTVENYTNYPVIDRSIVINKPYNENLLFFITADKQIIKNNISVTGINFPHIQVEWLNFDKTAVFNNGIDIKIVNKNKVKEIKTKYTPIGLKVIDSTGFFVGYYKGGGKIFNEKGEVIKEFLHKKSVTNFLKDHEGGYWISTLESGAYYIKNPNIFAFNFSKTNFSININSLAKKNKELLIGYQNGDYSSIKNRRIQNYEKAFSIANPSYVEFDSINNKTYVLKNNKLYIKDKLIGEQYFNKASEPTGSGVVYGGYPNGMFNLTTHTFIDMPWRVQDVSISGKDTLLATPLGIYKKNNNIISKLADQSKLFSYRSDDIDVSADGKQFFIATQGVGVIVFGKKILNITTKDGLTANIVNEVVVENDSIIWACTNKGLNRITFNKTNFNIDVIDKNRGLLSNEIEDIEIISDTVWVGTKQGLNYFHKKEIERTPSDNLFLKIKEIKVNNIIHNLQQNIKLNYKENKISFFVEAITYSFNNNLEYQFRLKEIDTKWSSTKSRNITFPNLKEGKYTFQVRACINDVCYNKNQLEYKFTIKPPFWKSWWFSVFCALVLGVFIYVFFKIRVLTYNKDIVREFIRVLIKRLKREETFLEIRMNGEDIKIRTKEIFYIKSSGNYLDIVCSNKTYTIRCKIGEFIDKTPDALEYLRVHRSYIIRIDKVTGKTKKSVTINDEIIPVGETYLAQLDNIHF